MKRLAALGITLGLLTAACGGHDGHSDAASAGDEQPDRTVKVEMVDINFRPERLEIKRGETVRFVFTNRGEAVHDAFIGSPTDQQEHEKEMQAADSKSTGHDEMQMGLSVKPGGQSELTYTFKGGGPVEIGCHQPGHYAAGMKLPITLA
jgi:uncharacterized cupredoxin-like copper-binding protein